MNVNIIKQQMSTKLLLVPCQKQLALKRQTILCTTWKRSYYHASGNSLSSNSTKNDFQHQYRIVMIGGKEYDDLKQIRLVRMLNDDSKQVITTAAAAADTITATTITATTTITITATTTTITITTRNSMNPNPNHNDNNYKTPSSFRAQARLGNFQKSTNGCCPGYIQCNLVVLRQPDAFDFLLFCQRNQQACPLVEVLNVGSFQPSLCVRNSLSSISSTTDTTTATATTTAADLRTDLPLYRIYRNGKHVLTTHNVIDYWPSDSVAFLIGCSFSADEALRQAGIPLRSNQNRINVPMYDTNIPCQAAGKYHGNMVVSMKPIPAVMVAKEVLVTSKFPLAHGPPVCIGCPQAIGIDDIHKPDYGDPPGEVLKADEVPVFHACGVTPQNVLCQSGVEFAITHEPGCMFVTDLKIDML
mmetsp:Transcript_11256/g.21055  ORF Transcript_11256/g.21055 Transcript_11256/m.21055 type:complete len:416 (+) Transcript_11256:33-1280(+)